MDKIGHSQPVPFVLKDRQYRLVVGDQVVGMIVGDMRWDVDVPPEASVIHVVNDGFLGPCPFITREIRHDKRWLKRIHNQQRKRVQRATKGR